MYSHFLFDADNTLLDFDKAQKLSFCSLLDDFSVQYSDEIYQQYETINHSLWNLFEVGKIDSQTVQEKRFELFFQQINIKITGRDANDLYQSKLSKQSILIPYATEVCKELSNSAELTIVTNGVGKTQQERIKNSAINKYISHVVISEDIGCAKPNKPFFDETFKIINRKPIDKILIVGDSLSSDIRGGILAGIDTCWFNRHEQVVPTDINIQYVITDLRQLLSIQNKCKI